MSRAKELRKCLGEKYSFKVKKNGKYTIWISDDKGNIYTKVVTVKGLKK